MAHKLPFESSFSRSLTFTIIVTFHILLLSALSFGILSTVFSTKSTISVKTNTELDTKVPYLRRAHGIRLDTLGVQIEELTQTTNRLVEMSEEGRGKRITMRKRSLDEMDNGTGREMHQSRECRELGGITGASQFVGCA
ncbi:hypothetical protein DL98DRAFT_580198 [Cadophora sp. DSE1049]|nr:hypothetical protein DL98DRAFT_580198 [Cadophora sp. DSE1049]